jgi:hypothetical protein
MERSSPSTRTWRLTLASVAVLLLALFVSAKPALAHWVADDTVVLEPYDPTPQIQFRHWDGGDCDHDCWLERHCGYDCQRYGYGYGYGGCDRDCGGWRDHDCDDWRDRDHYRWDHGDRHCGDDLVKGYLDRAQRSDDQSDQWNHSMDHWHADMDWYDHAVIGVGDHDHDHDHDDHDHDDHDHDHHDHP